MNAFLEAEAIDLFRIVHGEQKFAYERPIVRRRRAHRDADRREPAPDRRQRHHRHHQRGHRRLRRPGLLDQRHPRPPGRRTHDARDQGLHRSPAPTWCGTPPPAATRTRSTRTRTWRASVGLPGVIAHGMYTMALAARAVASWFPGAEVVSLGCKFTSPVVVPAEGGVDVEVAGEAKEPDGRAHDGRAHRHLRRAEGARHAQGRRPCLTLPAGPHHPAARRTRRASWVTATTEAELIDRGAATPPASRCWCVGGGSNLVVADEGFAGTVVEVATRGDQRPTPRTTPRAAACSSRSRPGSPGTTSSSLAVERGWVGVEALAGHPGRGRRDADPERRRLRPGGLPDHRVGAGLGPHAPRRAHVRQRRLRLRLPDLAVQGRPRPARRPRRHLPARQWDLGDAGGVRRAGPRPRRRAGRRAPLAEVREAVLGLRRGKGMVLDPDDHDTWSAGSFFTNPVARRRATCPTARPPGRRTTGS